MRWTPTFKRGSTFRVPVMVTDSGGVPVAFTDTVFTITPKDGSPFTLRPGNGKLTITAFEWKGDWSAGSFVLGDTVRYGGDIWRALGSTSAVPGSGEWELFAQFLFLVPDSQTSGFTWDSGAYRWRVEFGNGDVDDSYMTGLIRVYDG